MINKPKVAIQSVTGCAGCQLTIYFMEELMQILEKIDLVAAPMISSKNSKGPYDVLFLEGSVSSEDDLLRVKELREKTKILVALGTCACFGNVQSIKEFHNKKDLPKKIYTKTEHLKSVNSTEISNHVPVDYMLPGCPPSKEEILNFIQDLLLNKKPTAYNKPVCFECTLKENACLLEQGRECLGPLTNGACKALCPSVNHGCTGCRGPIDDLNYSAHKDLLRKNISESLFNQRIIKYAPRKYSELVKKI